MAASYLPAGSSDRFHSTIFGPHSVLTTYRGPSPVLLFIEAPTPHDLRRTVETRIAELRIPKEIRDRCLVLRIGRRHYERVASCPIMTVAGDQARATVGARRHHPVAVVLDLVNPAVAARRLGG
jgi:hypothetical protein